MNVFQVFVLHQTHAAKIWLMAMSANVRKVLMVSHHNLITLVFQKQ